MKKILILCVNYNSYEELRSYLQTIETAASTVNNSCKVEVLVGDNTVENQKCISTDFQYITINVFPYYKNLGYIGCVTKMLQDKGKVFAANFDYIIVSNVDILLTTHFFFELLQVDNKEVGWIAPSIVTEKTQKDENPYMLYRPSKVKLSLLQLLYTFPMVFVMYQLIYKFRHKERQYISNSKQCKNIYAGHGSIMIFSQKVVEAFFPFVFPAFMYGEEIFFAELVKKLQLNTIYYPTIVVRNIGNVSTRLLGNKKKCKMSKESLAIITKMFFLTKICHN